MGGLCCGESKTLETLGKGNKILRLPTPTSGEHKHALVRAATPMTEGVFQPTIHLNCSHNQLIAATNRVLGEVPVPTERGVAMMRQTVDRFLLDATPTSQDALEDLGNRHGGAKGRRYLKAARDYYHEGLYSGDSSCSMFVKSEKFDVHAKVNPDPRAIQFRKPKYCVVLASFLRPIEEKIYHFDKASKGVPRSRNVAKGLNSVDRAELLAEKSKHFKRPVFITLDASRYDKHISVSHLKMEHRFYLRHNCDPLFAKLLHQQLLNRCFSSLGLKYTTSGKRMSGDMNTASGNVIIMLIMVTAIMTYLDAPVWDTLDDGDDIVLIIEEDELWIIDYLRSLFLEMGMNIKVESVCRSLFEVKFCQSNIVEFAPARLKFVRDFRRVMSNAASGVRNWNDPRFRARAINATGYCELILNLGVPVLQSYALALLRNTGTQSFTESHIARGLQYRVKTEMKLLGLKKFTDVKPQRILSCARESFHTAFGLDPTEQVALERKLDTWTFDHTKCFKFPCEWEPHTWTGDQSICEVQFL